MRRTLELPARAFRPVGVQTLRLDSATPTLIAIELAKIGMLRARCTIVRMTVGVIGRLNRPHRPPGGQFGQTAVLTGVATCTAVGRGWTCCSGR